MLLRRITTLIALVVIKFSFSQIDPTLPGLVPPSPDVASFNKYVDFPVSLASGIPSIEIPIYNIDVKGVNVPISLSYNSSGLKVEEIASSVGLGWSLVAGGVISRTVRDLPDDNSNGYINTSYTIQSLRNVPGLLNPFSLEDGIGGAIQSEYGGVINLERDYQPDIFNFNFPGYSGKLVYDQDNDSFVQIPGTNLIIVPIFEGLEITAWKITTPNGVVYYFGKSRNGLNVAHDVNTNFESTTYSSSGSTVGDSGITPNHISAWHLVEIVVPGGQTIEFNYEQNTIQQYLRSSEQYTFPGSGSGCVGGGYSGTFQSGNIDETRISAIHFPEGDVQFVYDTNTRLDVTGGEKLNEIRILTDSGLFKKFILGHGYFTASTSSDGWPTNGDVNQRIKRLYLQTITEVGSDGLTMPPYMLEYNTDVNLPSRFSNGQDYWGYYNGKDSNDELIPRSQITSSLYVYDNDRSVDTILNQANILKKVIYPTGGSTAYFYQTNRVQRQDLVTKNIFPDYNLGSELLAKQLYMDKNPSYIIESNPYPVYGRTFDLQGVVGLVHVSLTVSGCDNSGPLTNFDCDYSFKIQGVSNPTYQTVLSSNNMDVSLPEGIYEIQAIDNGNSGENDFTVAMNWEADPHPDIFFTGGLRVSKIVHNDAHGNVLYKEYDYTDFVNNEPSGIAIATPVFVDTKFLNYACDNNGTFAYKITSYSQIPGIQINSASTGYQYVTEKNADGGKTEYTFSKIGDFYDNTPGYNEDVITPEIDISWRRGVMQKKEDYAFDGSAYTKVRTEEYTYESFGTYFLQNFGFKFETYLDAARFSYYGALTEWFRLKTTNITMYFDEGDVITQISNEYSGNPLLPSKVTELREEGDVQVNKYYYPDDITSASFLQGGALSTTAFDAVQKMKSNGAFPRIGTLIQVEEYLKPSGSSTENLISQSRVDMKDWTEGLLLPEFVKTSKVSDDFDNRVKYTRYDEVGNPLELSRSDGPKIVYVWGYNRSYPIAKIENASYAEVAQALGVTEIGLEGYNESNLPSLDLLRNSLPGSMVTTYTYNPLIGINTITDPKGDKLFYTYDSLGRLVEIKDSNNKLISTYDYHHKN